MTTRHHPRLLAFHCVICLMAAAVALVPSAYAQRREPPPPQQQPEDEAFKAGLEAREAKNWQETAVQMRRAIQIDPKEDDRKIRRGIRGVFGSGNEYLPYYYLGEALFNAGDCAGAVEAWSISEQQRVVLKRPEYVTLFQKGYAACERKGVLPPAKYAAILERTRQFVTDVTQLAKEVTSTGTSHPDLWRASTREQYDRASDELQNAHSRLANATRTRSEREFADASAAADRARNLLTTLDAQLKTAIESKKSSDALAKEVDRILREGEASDRELDAKEAVLASSPSLSSARQKASAALANARAQLNGVVPGNNDAALADLRTAAQDSAGKLKSLLDEVAKVERDINQRRFTDMLSPAEQALTLVMDGFATIDQRVAQNPSRFTPELTAERDAVQKEAVRLQRRLDAARKAESVPGIEEVRRIAVDLRVRLDALIAQFGPPTLSDLGIRPALVEGARLFFEGKYREVLATLDVAGLGEIPYQLHVHLFRAAALHALWVRTGEKDQDVRTQALDEIGRCRQLNASFQPDARAFGPRFVSFFNAAHAAAPAAAAPASPQQ